MRTETLEWASKSLRHLLLISAIAYLVVYLVLVFFRLSYPFELEWLEGGSLEQVQRILAGQKLYVSPSLEFIPFIYPPLYFYVSAVLAALMGVGFLPLRVVSFISSLGAFGIIFLLVRRETKSNFAGILAACLFIATFRLSNGWFDLARVDSLLLFFVLSASYLVRFSTSWKAYVLAGFLFSLAILTKQTALLIALPVVLYAILLHPLRSVFLVGSVGLLTAASTLFLNLFHDGWYKYYVFDLPSQQAIAWNRLIGFWTTDLMSSLSLVCIMALFYVLARFSSPAKTDLWFYLALAAGMLGGSWFGRLNAGGYGNTLIPAFACLSILFGLAFNEALRFLETALADRRWLRTFLYLVCIIQFAILVYNPARQIPPEKDLQAGEQVIKTLREIKGDVFIPSHGYLAELAGKPEHAHAAAIFDVQVPRAGEAAETRTRLLAELREAIREKRFSAIIIDYSTDWLVMQTEVEEYYAQQGSVFDDPTIFFSVAGFKTRPEEIYVPKQ